VAESRGSGDRALRRVCAFLCLVALAAASGVFAASGDEFYDRLYTRGVSQFGQGNYAGAYSSLRLAAFGFVDDLARFETAQIYMAVSATRLKRESDARAAALRVVTAERIQRRYASLALPDALRKDFEDASKKLLTADQMGVLRGVGAGAPPPPPSKTIEITVPGPVLVNPPAPQPPQPKAAPSFTEAERALNSGDLAAAAGVYRALLDTPKLTHGAALRIAEGFYRARDFGGAIRAFERAGPIVAGEEQFHYYYAVALYETGRYAAAKRELQAALPYIEVTPDVDRYRSLIEQRAGTE
jgi:tetratricopeptide (TPR) repeat protein